MADEKWTGSKRQRDALRSKYGGRCAYCGGILDKMQADHLEPVTRITTDPWGKPLPVEDRRLIRPERNVVSNMMPACPPCNLHKGGYRLEEWRALLSRADEILAREKSLFRAALRFGVLVKSDAPVTFHFEETARAGGPGGHWATRDNEPDSRTDPEGHRDWQRDRDAQREEGTW